MDNIQRSIGKLENMMSVVVNDVKEIKEDVKSLNNFKWRMAGGAAVLSILLTIAVEAMKAFYH